MCARNECESRNRTRTKKTNNYAHTHVLSKCVTSLLGFMCFVLMFLWILVFTLSLVSDVSPFSKKVLYVNFLSPRIRDSKYKVLSSGCCSPTLSCHRQLNLYPKFLHISHRENGSSEVLSLHVEQAVYQPNTPYPGVFSTFSACNMQDVVGSSQACTDLRVPCPWDSQPWRILSVFPCLPGINPEFVMECKLIAHPIW